MISRVEHGFNLYWIRAYPELFGKTVAEILADCPPDQWNVTIKPAYMPGEKYMIVCTLREPTSDAVIDAHDRAEYELEKRS